MESDYFMFISQVEKVLTPQGKLVSSLYSNADCISRDDVAITSRE